MALLPGASQQVFISLLATLGEPDYSHLTALSFSSQPTLNGVVLPSYPVEVPSATIDQTVNLPSIFPAITNLVCIAVMDITNPGQNFSLTTTAGSGRMLIAASSPWFYMAGGGAPPIIYLSNSNLTTSLILITLISN